MKTIIAVLVCVVTAVFACVPADHGTPPPGSPGESDGFFEFMDAGPGFSCFVDTNTDAGTNPEPVIQSSPSPAPIAGGTLIVARDGTTAVASDPDHDQVVLVDLTAHALVAAVSLNAGDEPGRLIEDGSRRVHVALRRGGAVATVDLATHALVERQPVCPEPRGIAYDAAANAIHVACTDGELVTLPASGGAPTRRLHLDLDLRDVVVGPAPSDGGLFSQLWVTTFRGAQVLVVTSDGSVAQRTTPAGAGMGLPGVAWRTVAGSSGSLLMLHQEATTTVNLCTPNPYGGSPGSGGGGFDAGQPEDAGVSGVSGASGAVVTSALSSWTAPTSPGAPVVLPSAVLAVDVAVSPDGSHIAIAAPGSDAVFELGAGGLSQVFTSNPEPVAVAFDPAGNLVIQTREPAIRLVHSGASIGLPGTPARNTGHRLFHHDAGKGIACASCHPEAREDGRTWNFFPVGPRRTMSVSGAILSRAPYHWNGDEADLGALMSDVFIHRMGGLATSPVQDTVLGQWLDPLPAPAAPPVADPAAVARGQSLFESPSVGCASCHAGALLTNNLVLDVGTGAAFKTPSLRGVWARAPFLHDGCAATLKDRFGSCATARHGQTGQLTRGQIDDLVAFLQTL